MDGIDEKVSGQKRCLDLVLYLFSFLFDIFLFAAAHSSHSSLLSFYQNVY